MFDKIFYIYKTTNLINGKIYIGKRSTKNTIKNDSKYLGSGLFLLKAIKKYGIENFKKEIIEFNISNEENNKREKYYIDLYQANKNNNFYNIVEGGQGGFRKMSDDGKRRISEANSKRIYSKSTLLKMSNSLKGKKISDNQKKQISIKLKGRKQSEISKLKRSISLKLFYQNNISIMKGRKTSEETKIKMSNSAKLKWLKIKYEKSIYWI